MRLSVNTPEDFYPDLIEKGGLAQALQSAFSEIRSPVKVKELDVPLAGLPIYARVESRNRFSQIYISAEQRMFSSDFWQDGVALGNGYTNSLAELARVVHDWVETEVGITELCKKFSFVTADEKAKYFEQGREVDWKWQECQKSFPEKHPELVSFLTQASRNLILNRLFPFTSMNTFHFSRCTGFPYSSDCPFVVPLENNRYRVLDSKGAFIGDGDAVQAVELVVSHLPINSGTAVKGTTDDLEEAVYRKTG